MLAMRRMKVTENEDDEHECMEDNYRYRVVVVASGQSSACVSTCSSILRKCAARMGWVHR